MDVKRVSHHETDVDNYGCKNVLTRWRINRD